MTTLLDKKLPSTTPQVHVLIVGVGNYPFVKANADHENVPQLADVLQSPPKAAVRFGQFLFELSRNGNLPLGTVEMAISPAQFVQLGLPGEADGNVAEATLHECNIAFTAWKDRCDANREHLGIF
jgi:hypothetical protein